MPFQWGAQDRPAAGKGRGDGCPCAPAGPYRVTWLEPGEQLWLPAQWRQKSDFGAGGVQIQGEVQPPQGLEDL